MEQIKKITAYLLIGVSVSPYRRGFKELQNQNFIKKGTILMIIDLLLPQLSLEPSFNPVSFIV